jgi:uncharacterized protein (DUF2236 family)
MSAPGYFPRGRSVLRRVHGAKIVGWTYGQRALLMQATHPLAFAGLMANTTGLEAPFNRLAHTATTMERIFFGSRTETDCELERIRRLHERVSGTIEEPAGEYPAGSAYSATDPDFLLWILACLADSAQAAYETFVRELGVREREAFWRDYLLVGELFGLPRSSAPPTYREYRYYLADRLADEGLYVVELAREICHRIIYEMPVPAHREPALRVIHFAVLGLLPQRVRDLYGFEWGLRERLAFQGLARSLRIAALVTPNSIRRGSSAPDYELVARTERQRVRPAA